MIKKRWCREGFGAFGNPHRFGITFPCSKTFSRPTFLHFSGFPGGEYITQGVNISRRGRIYHPGEEYITQGENISPRGRIYQDPTKTLAAVKREAADDEDDDSSSAAPRRKRRRRSSRATPRAPLRRPVPQDALIV